jgi:hypothetical protein
MIPEEMDEFMLLQPETGTEKNMKKSKFPEGWD